ncbi:MAG: MFS transporter [Anaerolineales bacterium]
MIARLQTTYHSYHPQFWLMFVGMLISTIGASMIWPFLMIYVSENLEAPMTVAAGLMTLNSAAGLVASFLAGPFIDRLGRKWIMVGSLVLNALAYVLLSGASDLSSFAFLMILSGAVNPIYRIGGDAMVADLVPPEKRADSYALLRLSNNLGVAIGPAVGGFLASSSYATAFYFAAIGMILYSLLMAFFGVETLPKAEAMKAKATAVSEKMGGYLPILSDRRFIFFVITYTLVATCAALIWVILPVYAKTNYHLQEKLYGLIATTNAVMVVALQVSVTKVTKRYATLPVLAVGGAFYTVALGSVAFGQGFWGFWTSMVIMTMGELILVPTANTYAANLAPPDKRGRYMSIFGLSWRVAIGIGPIFGGMLNDNIGPASIWFGGAVLGALSVVFFLLQERTARKNRTDEPDPQFTITSSSK